MEVLEDKFARKNPLLRFNPKFRDTIDFNGHTIGTSVLPFESENRPLQVMHDYHHGCHRSESKKLLKTKYVNELKRYAVFKRVNRVENTSKECIEPLKDIND